MRKWGDHRFLNVAFPLTLALSQGRGEALVGSVTVLGFWASTPLDGSKVTWEKCAMCFVNAEIVGYLESCSPSPLSSPSGRGNALGRSLEVVGSLGSTPLGGSSTAKWGRCGGVCAS
jgi:hypothetical protein